MAAISHRFLRADPRLLRADFLVSHLYLHNSLLPHNRVEVLVHVVDRDPVRGAVDGAPQRRVPSTDAVAHLLTQGLDTPLSELARAGRDQDSLSRQ